MIKNYKEFSTEYKVTESADVVGNIVKAIPNKDLKIYCKEILKGENTPKLIFELVEEFLVMIPALNRETAVGLLTKSVSNEIFRRFSEF